MPCILTFLNAEAASTPILEQFYNAFIRADRWKLYLDGYRLSLIITLFAAIFGTLLGILLALMRLSRTKTGKKNAITVIADVYVDIIRGTPTMLQLLIMYFAVLVSVKNSTIVAIVTFSINSAAYVCEIVRAGIQAVDAGQMEAGRSLGLSKATTMRKIIIPQAIKNVLPPLGSEYITLLKETAIVGYVALSDLTRTALLIGTRTYRTFPPLLIGAVIYFITIKVFSLLLGKLERWLRRSDNR